MEKFEEKKRLPTMSNFSPQNYVFYGIEIRRTVLKQPVRIECLVKQKPRDALTFQVSRIAYRKKVLIEEVGSCYSLLS